MPLSKDLYEFVELLNANEVDYLVVGAFALAFHGVSRYTADLRCKNAEKVLHTLSQFGFASVDIQADDFQIPDRVIQLGVRPNRIDLLTGISGVSFDEAWETQAEGPLYGIRVHFIGVAALIHNKESRPRTGSRGCGGIEETLQRERLKLTRARFKALSRSSKLAPLLR